MYAEKDDMKSNYDIANHIMCSFLVNIFSISDKFAKINICKQIRMTKLIMLVDILHNIIYKPELIGNTLYK